MAVTSLQFLLFSVLTIALYNLAARLRWAIIRDGVFLFANGYFLANFANGGAGGFLPMAGFILLGYAGIWLLRDQRGTAPFWALMAATIGAFFWLKKYSFIPEAVQLSFPYATIGLSYMFFRILQVLIDAGSGSSSERPSLVRYLNYVLNFTTLISGPIQRLESFAAQQKTLEPLTWAKFGRATERIVLGVFKVTVLAAVLLAWHRQGLAHLMPGDTVGARSATGALAFVGYALYLYCNFSGYTDIVIGVARFLHIELPENFNRPFSALNFMDFWARWHMTLSNWLKTYVYNPLVRAAMERFPSPAADPYIGVLAFLVTFFLIGLWHGQTAVFALYGLLLGLGVSGNKLYQVLLIRGLGRKGYRALSSRGLYQALARGLTFTYFCVSLVCFWANWSQIADLFARFGLGGSAMLALVIFVTATAVLEAWERLRDIALSIELAGQPLVRSRYVRTVWVTGLCLISVAVVSLTATPAPDIVYKNF